MSLRGYCVELGEQVDQLALLFPAEWLEELVIEGFDGGQDLCESREALRRDRHDVATPVLGITGSLRVADSLEQVDKLDHVAAIDSESATQVLLRWFAQSPQRHEDQKVERSELPASEYLLEASLGSSANAGQQESRPPGQAPIRFVTAHRAMLSATVTVMNSESHRGAAPAGAASRRWLLGFEPVFEGGWLRKGARARAWEVERHLVAVALFGDVVVDLAGAKSLPAFVELHAYPVLRDVDVVVPEGMAVEVTGRWVADHVTCEVPDLPADRRAHVLRVVSHTFRGDVNIRVAAPGASSSSPGGR
jgi:hypothetical protein